jgi:type II secretory pathway component GspD/PulD (secretin)
VTLMRRQLSRTANTLKAAIALVVLAAPLVAFGQTSPPEAREAARPVVIKVVPLSYARAGELAYTLSLVASPRVRVVPYLPTNSLIISGPPTEVEQLIDIIKPSASE